MKSIIFLFTFSLSISSLQAQKFNSPNAVSVTVNSEEGMPLIEWETKREINTSFFIVERADSNDTFTAIRTVDASGYAQFPKSYRFLDETAESLTSRYRVTLVMMDGTRISAQPMLKVKESKRKPANVLATN
jgi:hypothetical protein